MSHPVARLVPVAFLVGCGAGGDGGVDAPPGGDIVGRIQIEEAELGAPSGAIATILAAFEAPDLPSLVDDGTCRIYPFPCEGQVGACAGRPGHSAGPITITGLATSVTLAPNTTTDGYISPGGLPAELFGDTASITAQAPGDEVAGFSLATSGVPPLESGYAGASLGLVPGQPLALTWTAVAGDARIQLRVNWANICHAGAEWYVLICEVADTGSFTVPTSITSHLPTGFSQCGARLARLHRATLPDRPISLEVASSDWFGFF